MKSESLVIVGQHTTVNTFPGLVHTARHTMGAVSYTHLDVYKRQAVPGGYVRLRRACHVRRTNVFV